MRLMRASIRGEAASVTVAIVLSPGFYAFPKKGIPSRKTEHRRDATAARLESWASAASLVVPRTVIDRREALPFVFLLDPRRYIICPNYSQQSVDIALEGARRVLGAATSYPRRNGRQKDDDFDINIAKAPFVRLFCTLPRETDRATTSPPLGGPL